MLLFIFIREEYLTEEANFNTSHVTVYRNSGLLPCRYYEISIHLMLLFIQDLLLSLLNIIEFQYISCYCLSWFLHRQVLSSWHFNTSHVTVYQNSTPSFNLISKFQYISCYCLSSKASQGRCNKEISIHLMLLFISCNRTPTASDASFQYISCYCLSSCQQHSWQLVYNFNTSHVTVYQRLKSWMKSIHLISIHLMLLFITKWEQCTLCRLNISIHLMLLFIHYTVHSPNHLHEFQYISCYCLSHLSFLDAISLCNFNTSHVTVYQRTCFKYNW